MIDAKDLYKVRVYKTDSGRFVPNPLEFIFSNKFNINNIKFSISIKINRKGSINIYI